MSGSTVTSTLNNNWGRSLPRPAAPEERLPQLPSGNSPQPTAHRGGTGGQEVEGRRGRRAGKEKGTTRSVIRQRHVQYSFIQSRLML
jgi:hypothetical protein